MKKLFAMLFVLTMTVPCFAEEWSLRIGTDLVRPGDSQRSVMNKVRNDGGRFDAFVEGFGTRETLIYNEGGMGFKYLFRFEHGILQEIERLDERGN